MKRIDAIDTFSNFFANLYFPISSCVFFFFVLYKMCVCVWCIQEARTQTSNKPMVVELVLVADFREVCLFTNDANAGHV